MNKRRRQAQQAHEKWVRKVLAGVNGGGTPPITRQSLKVENPPGVAPVSNQVPSHSPRRRTVLEDLDKETPEVRAQIRQKARDVAPHYNKGPYQYAPNPDVIKENKRR